MVCSLIVFHPVTVVGELHSWLPLHRCLFYIRSNLKFQPDPITAYNSYAQPHHIQRT